MTDSASPVLALLGPPSLRHPGGVVAFRAERPFLLLAYLASRGGWVRRDELAELLYPGRPMESSRSNLRKVLHLARRLPGVGDVEQLGDELRWVLDSDLRRFDRACDEQRLDDAIAGYGGPLLQGMDGSWPRGAADWLQAERQRLQARWRDACVKRLAQLAADPQAACALAERLLQQDPLDEVALHCQGRAQAALGFGADALARLDDHARRLSTELGLAPSAALQQLTQDLQGGPARPSAAAVRDAGFVGRRLELAEIGRLLAVPGCRALTLLGPPGIGKTALGRAAALELASTYPAGAHWTALGQLTQCAQVPERIAATLGAVLGAADSPWDALPPVLAARSAGAQARAMLLVMDNAEHLALAEPLAAMLAACPTVQCLLTSRQRLGLPGEWLLPLQGLPLPDEDETDVDVLRHNDAVRLLEARALPLAPNFRLADEAADVIRLLYAVEGLPLAIELLAPWRRLMPMREIVAELGASLDLLEPTMPHERSVRASFARSWQQLGPFEQRALGRLAVLPGPIGREMARQVAGAPPPVLAALVDKSLLRADADGRFSLHPLVRRCAATLAPDDASMWALHARHVAHWMGRTAPSESALVAEIGRELAHVRAAWRWAVDAAEPDLLGAMVRPLGAFHNQRGYWHEGIAQLLAALNALRGLGGDARTRHVELSTQIALAGLQYACGDLDGAEATAEAGLVIAREIDAAEGAGVCSQRIGSVRWQRGDYAGARECMLERLSWARRHGGTGQVANAVGSVALVDKALGNFDAALAGYQEALRLCRQSRQVDGLVTQLINLASLLRGLDRAREGEPLLTEALQLCETHELNASLPFVLANIGLMHEALGEHVAAADWLQRGLQSARVHGEPMIEAAMLLGQARVLARGKRDLNGAWTMIQQSLAIADRLQLPPLAAQTIASAGRVMAFAGERTCAALLLQWAAAQPSIGTVERQVAQQALDALGLDAAALEAERRALPPASPLADVVRHLPQTATRLR